MNYVFSPVEKLSFTNLYVLKILIHHSTFGYAVSFVEAEFLAECIFTEPNLYKGVHQPFIRVICHTATILNLTYHVTNSTPGDPLKPNRKKWLQLILFSLMYIFLSKNIWYTKSCNPVPFESKLFSYHSCVNITLYSQNNFKDFSKYNSLATN